MNNILYSIIMLEVLVLSLVGLTYTCVQTLFFLNCLNSRRREQRRLEKAYRDSIRKVKAEVGVGKANKKNNTLKESPSSTSSSSSSSKENGNSAIIENGIIENGKEEGDSANESLEDGGGGGRLVTRLVVTSGKEALPTSQEERAALHGVRIHKAIVKLSDPSLESEKESPITSNGLLLPHDGETDGTPTIGSKRLSSYNITVNSNMIEIGGYGGSVNSYKEPIYESLEGDPVSMATEVTTCEDGETTSDCQNPNKPSLESVSVGMPNSLKEQEMVVIPELNPPPKSIDVHSISDLQEVQEERMDVDDICSTEDELEEFYHKSLRHHRKRENINLVTTISQILCSPPESMEPGSEIHALESLEEPEVNGLEFQAKSDDLNGSSRSHLSTSLTIDCEGEPQVANSVVGLPLEGDLTNQRHGESREEIKCDGESQLLKLTNAKGPRCPPRGKGTTWTLPRAGKRIPEGHRSLPRTRARLKMAGIEEKGTASEEKMILESPLHFSGQQQQTSSLHPKSGHSARRDAAPGGTSPYTHLNTCHSTPDMAGAATVPPDTTHDGNHCTTTTTTTITTDIASATTNVTSCTVHNNAKNSADIPDEKVSPKKTSNSETQTKKTSNSETQPKKTSNSETRPKKRNISETQNSLEKDSDLKLMIIDPSSTSIHSDDHTDSEESADSLYYTASDHTNSDTNSEIRGDSEDSFETIVYESIETPSDVRKVSREASLEHNRVNSRQNETMAVNRGSVRHKNAQLTPLSHTINIFEVKNDIKSGELKSKTSSRCSDTIDDVESIGSESQYETVSDSDQHRDSGYESPVKADIHSSDDAASTASNSSMENHYEDINTANLGKGGRPRDSTRRGRSMKDSPSAKDALKEGREGGGDDDDDDGDDSDEVRQRQRLQELDDLIAEFGDTSSSGSNDSRIGDAASSGHRQLHITNSVPPNASSASSANYLQQRSPLQRTSSEPSPPPPPPMPCHTPSPRSSPAVTQRRIHNLRDSGPKSLTLQDASGRVSDYRDHSEGSVEEGVFRPSEFIRRNSQRGHKKVDRPMSLPLDVAEHYGKIMSNGKDKIPSTTQDDSSSSTLPAKPHLSNGKSLPFIPPKFPSQPSGSGLIKPSEYLRSLGSTSSIRSPSNSDVKSLVAMHSSETHSSSFDNCDHNSHNNNNNIIINDTQPASMPPGPLPSIPEATEEEPSRNGVGAPPPPPAPPAPPVSSSANTLNRSNTLNSSNTNNSKSMLPTISVTDLQSVQLRKTETKVAKTNSVPLHMPLSPEPMLTLVKNDVIAELKKGVDISGIKKLKSEKAKEEAKNGILEKEELNRQFTAVNFVDQIAAVDNAGNRIPEWKRQMLARKAAERAKKLAEETHQQELEEKRLLSIPPWKRQLMTRKDDGKRDRPVTPRTQSPPVRIALHIKHSI